MSHKDRRGRDLKAFLQAEVVGGDIELSELLAATQIKPGRWYNDKKKKGTGRRDADDFPNAEELRHVAEYYSAKGYAIDFINLLVEFGLAEPRADAPGYTAGSTRPFALLTRERGTATGRRARPRGDAPAL